MPLPKKAPSLTERQFRELEYHRHHALEHGKLADLPLDTALIESSNRRWWNHYWSMYTAFQAMGLQGASILVDGCGFGNDALSLAVFAGPKGKVRGNDLSPESVDVAEQRARNLGLSNIRLDVAPCENLPYDDDSFDLLVLVDILHHVDIAKTMAEARRVLKPGGRVVIAEPYTHSLIQRIVRNNAFVERLVYPAMRKFIYQTDKPYITDDERKIDNRELDYLLSLIEVERIDYFYVFLTRIIPDRFVAFAKLDKVICNAMGTLGRYFAARFVLYGRIDAAQR